MAVRGVTTASGGGGIVAATMAHQHLSVAGPSLACDAYQQKELVTPMEILAARTLGIVCGEEGNSCTTA